MYSVWVPITVSLFFTILRSIIILNANGIFVDKVKYIYIYRFNVNIMDTSACVCVCMRMSMAHKCL